MKIETWTKEEALARQDQIRDLLSLPDEEVRRREFPRVADQILAEEYIRLNLLLYGHR